MAAIAVDAILASFPRLKRQVRISQYLQCIKNGRCNSGTTDEVLIAIGKVLEKLPSITALLKLFSG